jgi:L-Lysine epsilon oxidase N-terminal/L-lysine epsilon oxidase C-terminal domain
VPSKYRIHPAIGIARLGDSPDEFCISPEKPAALPIACDAQGNALMSPDGRSEATVTRFKDVLGRIKRQAARFQIYAYSEEHPEGRLLSLGDEIEGGGNAGTLVDIQWRVYVANKKSVWYTFSGLEGEHGYSPTHPLRNADITGDDARQQLIIDPGPRFVDTTSRRRASFDRDGNGVYATRFPPKDTTPRNIDTLGEIMTDDHGCLLVLGGHGNSGTFKTGVGQPVIENYANTDGWFDDISDGPVMARLVMFSKEVQRQRFVDVEYPAWVVTGYPRYAPQILDLVTLEDVVYDLAVRKFAYRTDLYGLPGSWAKAPHIDTNDAGALMHWNAAPLDWNPDYKPWFYRDIWPILFRADEMSYLNNVLQQSNYPHNQSQRGNFDVTRCSVPPMLSPRALVRLQGTAIARNKSGDLFLDAIQIKLHMFDDAVERALHGKLRTHGSIDGGAPPGNAGLAVEHEAHTRSLFTQLRAARSAVREMEHRSALDSVAEQYEAALKSAVTAFAQEVLPPDGLSPTEYLSRWRAANELDAPAYVAAARKLRMAVDDALEPFIEATIAHWEGGLGHAGTLPAFLHSAAAQSGSVTNNLVEDVIRRAIHDIAAGAMTRFRTGGLIEAEFHKAIALATNDPFHDYRNYLYKILRRPGEENVFRTAGKPDNRNFQLPLMPLLAGDGPDKNELPSKFLRLTDYQLYILRQWAEGSFFNEVDEGWVPDTAIDPFQPYLSWENRTPRDLDRGVLSNLLGGAFFPGAEVCWTIRNPSIYKEPFRLKADPAFYTFGQTAANENQTANGMPVSEQSYLGNSGDDLSQSSDFETGLQPGDMTKYSALPWQADFNECTTQDIDITYEIWNVIDPDSENDPWLRQEQKVWETLWWPAHRPLQTFEVAAVGSDGKPVYQFLTWSRGVPQTHAGDLKMVTEWTRLGFLIRNPYLQPNDLDVASPDKKYISVERNQEKS